MSYWRRYAEQGQNDLIITTPVRGLYQRLAGHQKLANAVACKEMHVK